MFDDIGSGGSGNIGLGSSDGIGSGNIGFGNMMRCGIGRVPLTAAVARPISHNPAGRLA